MPAVDEQERFLERLPLLGGRPLAYGVAVATSLVAWWLRHALDPVFPPGFPYLTFFPAVIVSSFLFGRGPGTLAAVLCGLIAWYWYIPPFGSFELVTGTAVALAFYVGVVTVDITLVYWMQRANERLRGERERSRALATRNELLFSELQHRVANNVQMIGAVLSLQKRGIVDAAARKAMDDAVGKLQLIGRIQRQLYDLSGTRAAAATSLAELARDLVAAGGKPGVTCAVDAAPDMLLDPDAMIPLALIMAEGVANAIEHGFAARDAGHIDIRLARSADGLSLCVSDDGAGLPPGFDGASASSLGLKIAHTLARQLGGTLTIEPSLGGGARTSLSVPRA